MKLIFFLPILLIGITPVFAETGYDYFKIKNPDGSVTFRTHEPYILNLNTGMYEPFVKNGNQILTNHGSVILEADGIFSFYKKGVIDDSPLFTDKIIAKYADISDLNTWTYPNTLNNDTPDILWDGTQYVSTKIRTGVGQLDYKYILEDGEWKTQLEATNLSGLTTKAFGFDQIIDLNRDTIFFGKSQRNLDNFNGTTFNKTWLQANEGKVIRFLNGIDFDFDKGYENLYSITVYDTGINKSRLVFDYRTNTPLLPGETLIIDPTFSSTPDSEDSNVASDATPAECNGKTVSGVAGVIRASTDPGICRVPWLTFDITSIPTGSSVISAKLTYDVTSTDITTTSCYLFDYAVEPSAGQASYDAVFTAVGIATANTDCQSVTDNKIFNMNTTGITKIQENITGGEGFYALGIWFEPIPSITTDESVILRSGDATLEIIYVAANKPNRINDLTYANLSTNTLDLLWTQPGLNGGNLTNYRINFTTPHGNPQTFLANTTNTYYNVTGLTFNTDYSFRVSALTEGGYNATGNILNVTTTSTTYSNPPTLTAFGPSSANTQINLEFPGSTMNNINGYRIQRETPIGTGWVTIVSNTTTATQYYNNTGLTANIIYNYRVYAMNGSGISTVSNEYDMTTFHLPDAVTDLTGSATDLSTIELEWSAPTSYAPEIIGYRINGTTPTGEPVDVLNSNTGTTATTASALNLVIGQEYSFRVSAITVHGLNASGNIWNGSTIQTFVIGNLSNPDITNDDDFSIFFDRTDVNSSAIQLDVTYPNSYDLSCDFSYKYARTNQTYAGLTTVPNGTDDQVATFTLINATGDLVQVRCWDVLTGDESIYVITITDFPFLQYVNNLRNGEYGTFFQIGAFDGVMLVVIFLGMIGLNKTTPIVGITFVVITTFALSFFGFITYPEIMYPALIMMVVWAFITTRKDD